VSPGGTIVCPAELPTNITVPSSRSAIPFATEIDAKEVMFVSATCSVLDQGMDPHPITVPGETVFALANVGVAESNKMQKRLANRAIKEDYVSVSYLQLKIIRQRSVKAYPLQHSTAVNNIET
jgi:hypothetical protein